VEGATQQLSLRIVATKDSSDGIGAPLQLSSMGIFRALFSNIAAQHTQHQKVAFV
jgi:hypothetical protein